MSLCKQIVEGMALKELRYDFCKWGSYPAQIVQRPLCSGSRLKSHSAARTASNRAGKRHIKASNKTAAMQPARTPVKANIEVRARRVAM